VILCVRAEYGRKAVFVEFSLDYPREITMILTGPARISTLLLIRAMVANRPFGPLPYIQHHKMIQ
jgi:hypothetical protein